jgi:hypothetical protein
METTIFENFLEYCSEDNPQLVKDIETWLADYFDLPNRHVSLTLGEEDWIECNLNEANQRRILGYTLSQFKKVNHNAIS